jgi:hypothetical protein
MSSNCISRAIQSRFLAAAACLLPSIFLGRDQEIQVRRIDQARQVVGMFANSEIKKMKHKLSRLLSLFTTKVVKATCASSEIAGTCSACLLACLLYLPLYVKRSINDND